MFEEIAILGPGLLGASLIQALKRNRLVKRAVAWSRRPETRVKCSQQPWCDAVYPTPSEAVAHADLVVACIPVEHIVPLLEEVAAALQPGAIVTDVGSTKSLITRHAHAAMPSGVHFVGAHPMAGSEKTGLEHAFPELFENRACLVTPLPETDAAALEKVVTVWTRVGMNVATVSPESHDEIVAHISHLPHLLASTLCAYLAGRDSNWRNFAGNGLRDTTRIAAGDPAMWKSIVVQNKEEILRSLAGFEDELARLRSAIHNDNVFELLRLLEHGKTYRDQLPL